LGIADRKGEESCYVNLVALFSSLGEYAKAKKYSEKALEWKLATER